MGKKYGDEQVDNTNLLKAGVLMKFNGDIIIIDPCNVVKSEDDWEKCRYGEEMSLLGFSNYLYIDAGDEYGCTVINTDTNERIGKFCTDSAVLVVLLFDELLNYNPDFRDHIDYPNSNTLIRNFDGYIEVDEEKFIIFGKGNVNFTTVAE